jgi:tetratricopeptide (TPR) repeat protein
MNNSREALPFVALGIAVVILVTLVANRDQLARIAWENYQNPMAASVLASSDVELLMQLGNYYFGGGEYDLGKAFAIYTKAVELDPKVFWGEYQIARINFVRSDFEEALSSINREIDNHPTNLRALYIRGLIYAYRGKTGDLEQAISDFERFVEWAPQEWAGYNDLAWLYSTVGKYDSAHVVMERAFLKVPEAADNPWLWNSLGLAELNLKKYSKAAEAFEEAQRLAANLSIDDWRKSYSGNDPRYDERGVEAFREAISKNLLKAKAGQ